MTQIKTQDEFTTLHRTDGKIIISSKEVYDHIQTHAKPGKGSVFSGKISTDMINEFLLLADVPESGGGITANFPSGGYLLVAPFDIAMKLENASVYKGEKEDFDPEQGKVVPVSIAEVHTTQPISDFAVSNITVLVFPYDPNRSSKSQNEFVNKNKELSNALSKGNLYALATAFPGGFEIDEVAKIKFKKQKVPRAIEWGALDNPKWAVIIPDSLYLASEKRSHHDKWKYRKLKSLREDTLKELEDTRWQNAAFINGQLEHGVYDHQDIWGPYGHVASLRLVQEVINEKRKENNLPEISWDL